MGNDSEISLNLNFTEHVMKTETFVIQEDVDLRNQLELFWDIDTLGVKSDEPSEVHTNFKNNLVFNGARYEITLSFKSNHPLLADNYVQCKKRLESLVKRLRKAAEILTQYDKIIKQQQADGIIELILRNCQPQVRHIIYHIEK